MDLDATQTFLSFIYRALIPNQNKKKQNQIIVNPGRERIGIIPDEREKKKKGREGEKKIKSNQKIPCVWVVLEKTRKRGILWFGLI